MEQVGTVPEQHGNGPGMDLEQGSVPEVVMRLNLLLNGHYSHG